MDLIRLRVTNTKLKPPIHTEGEQQSIHLCAHGKQQKLNYKSSEVIRFTHSIQIDTINSFGSKLTGLMQPKCVPWIAKCVNFNISFSVYHE